MPAATFQRTLEVRAEPEQCWATLTDVPLLTSWVSIVSEAEIIDPMARYSAVLMDKLGPFKLRADLAIRLSDVVVGEHVHLFAEGEDRAVASRIVVDATLHLTPTEQGTRIEAQGRYEVNGRVASTGTSMIRKKADKVLDEFFAAAQRELA